MANIEELKQGFALSDIALVVLRVASKNYAIKTASEAEFKTVVDAGQEKALRKKNAILALSKTDDLVKGYDVSLMDLLLHPEILGLIEGGVVENTSESEATFKNFKGPVAGNAVTRQAFGLDIYCENVDTGSTVTDYLKFSVENCKGKPTEFTLKDGDFYTPKFTIESRPAKGQNTITIEKVATLPEVA